MRSLAVLVCAALMFPHTVLAAEPVSVEIETSNLDRDGPTLEKQLRARITEAFAEEGMTVDPQAQQRSVRIRVRRNEVMGYEVEISLQVEGDVVASGVDPFVCDPCRVLDLYDRVEGTIPQVVTAIREHEAPPPTPAEAVVTEPAEPVSTEDGREAVPVPDATPRKAKAMGAVGIVGAVVGVGGIGALVFGATRINKVEMQRSPTEDQVVITEDSSTQGWAWFGVGIGALAVGATMVAVDLTVLRRHRERRLSVIPDLRRGTAGLVLRGRF